MLEAVKTLHEGGFRAFLVGGCVRDLLRGGKPKDFDVASSARPEQVQKLFKKVIPTGIEHGTVTVVLKGEHVEVTTFRAEAEYLDGRRPSKVDFHEDIEADLSRRDFTMNAIAWDPVKNDLVDPFDGQGDLARHTVRCVRKAFDRFSEDGLRPLRAVRFATVLDFELEAETEKAIGQTLDVFRKVAQERVHQEFVKLLASPQVVKGLTLLERTGLLGAFLPEARPRSAHRTLAAGKPTAPTSDAAQFSEAFRAADAAARLNGTALEFQTEIAVTFEAVGRATADEPLRLAVLLYAQQNARDALMRLKFPNKVAEEAAALAKITELPAPTASDAELRRFLAKITIDRGAHACAMHHALTDDSRELAITIDRLLPVIHARPPLTAKDLALDGKAIMTTLGVGPSPAIGQATRFLVDQVLDEPARNTPEQLTKLLHGWSPKA